MASVSEDKCGVCGNLVSGKEKGVQCENCDGWFHGKCEGVSEEKYKFLMKHQDIHWFCKNCESYGICKVLKSIQVIKQQLEKTAEKQQKMETELERIKREVPEMKATFESKVKDCVETETSKRFETTKEKLDHSIASEPVSQLRITPTTEKC